MKLLKIQTILYVIIALLVIVIIGFWCFNFGGMRTDQGVGLREFFETPLHNANLGQLTAVVMIPMLFSWFFK